MSNRALLVLSALAFVANGAFCLWGHPPASPAGQATVLHRPEDRPESSAPPRVAPAVPRDVPSTTAPTPAPSPPPSAPSLPPPSFQVRDAGGKAVLEGTLPDEAHRATLLTAARNIYGPDGVLDQLQVGPVGEAEWLRSLPRMLTALRLAQRPSGAMKVDGAGQVELFGLVGSEPLRERIVSDIEKMVPAGWKVSDRMVLRGPGEGRPEAR